MTVYRLFWRLAGTDDPFVPRDDNLFTHAATALATQAGLEWSNARRAELGEPDREYRMFSVRITEDQFIPVS